MTALAEFMIIACADKRSPMLEKSMYDSWKSRMELYIENRENKRMILNSILNGLAVYVFTQEDARIAYLNKTMAILSVVVASRFPSTNNQLRTSFNLRNHATIQDGKEGKQGLLNVIIIKVKDTWLDNALRLKGMLHDPGILDGQAAQKIIPNNTAFQTKDLDAYDFDCDDVSTAQAVLMANLSNYGSYVISEENANQETYNESLTAELKRYKERVKTFEQRLNIDLSTREKNERFSNR
nr:hypothetical protein [Tanacetum cinerariifolium]